MSNKKHPKCALRNLANEAKKRLLTNVYDSANSRLLPPKDVTPSQREIFLKLCSFMEEGREIENPIRQLADQNLLNNLPHADRQRYILQLSADYASMKKVIDIGVSKRKSRS